MVDISKEKLDVLLVLPCYNEEQSINSMLNRLRVVKKNIDDREGLNFEILIINDGSTDNTKQILDENNHDYLFTIIHFKENKGYGYTLKTGFNYAKEMNFKWIITFDMDEQHEPKCIYKFIDQLLDNPIEQIISGSRYKTPESFWQNPWKDRFLVNTIITGILNNLGFSLTDAFCGLKAYECGAINSLDLTVNGYEIPIEVWIKAKQKGYSITEMGVPIIYKDRDEALKNAHDSFLFKKGEERIEKYILLIESLTNTPLKTDIKVFKSIFTDYINTLDGINKDNFKNIQDSIFKKIKELEV